MEIQNISVVVPTKGCLCKCKTCVSLIHEHKEHYENLVESNNPYAQNAYYQRLQFARDNGCNTMVLTGAPGEPLQNVSFLKQLHKWNNQIRKPFQWIEMQTTGVLLNDDNLQFLRKLGISTISLSNFNIFDDEKNFDVIGAPKVLRFNVGEMCEKIKNLGFNLRMCLNMTNTYETNSPAKTIETIFQKLLNYGVDQVTLRKLYTSNIDSEINEYIKNNTLSNDTFYKFLDTIKQQGNELETLPFGATKYSVTGISTVLDDNCMLSGAKQSIRYLILRENCKLYSRWDDKGSLIF